MGLIADDPVEKYKELVTAVGASRPVDTSTELEQVLAALPQPPAPAAEQNAIIQHVAASTPLTAAQAAPLVASALQGQQGKPAPTTTADKASAVSNAVSAAAGLSADIELSSPVMLKPWARIVFALFLSVLLGACIDGLLRFADKSQASNGGLVSLGVIGALLLIGILVLVMGYGNVTIKGGQDGSSTGG